MAETDIFLESDFNLLGDAEADRDAWLAARKKLLTSSDMFTWTGDYESWWSSTRKDIIDEKFHGARKEFPPNDAVSIHHGSFDEANIIRKTGVALGADVQGVNWLVTNPKWEHLGASIDGFIAHAGEEPDPLFFQDKKMCKALVARLKSCGEPAVLEIKKSLSRKWPKAPPNYYADYQCQAQMHILDIPGCIISAETVKDVRMTDENTGRAYYRRFWNLAAYWLDRDEAFIHTLDQLNDEFGETLHSFEEA